jgi:methionyl-tRNA formyltransferase
MQPLKLIFMGTPEFALPTLEAIAMAGHSIVAVYTQPPRPAGRGKKESLTPVHDYAQSVGLPVFTPTTLKNTDVQQRFSALAADAAVVAAYGLLLPEAILKATPMGCINVHPSLLPRWRGAAPIPRTLMAGDTETGVVIMQMDAGLDTGDMLMVKRYAIPPGTNSGELQDTLSSMAAPMVLETLEGLVAGTITPLKQPQEGVTYAAKITKGECRIDWNESAEAICRTIAGLSPQPCAHFVYKGETIKIYHAEAYPAERISGDIRPGQVQDDRLTIGCGTGAICNLYLQRPGKKPMTASELLRGYPIPAGAVFE